MFNGGKKPTIEICFVLFDFQLEKLKLDDSELKTFKSTDLTLISSKTIYQIFFNCLF